MVWKNIPTWLKGGIIGIIFAIIITIFLYGFLYEQIVYDGCHSREKPGDVYSQCDMINDQMKSSTISAQYNSNFVFAYIFVFVIISIILFAIGSVLGLLCGFIIKHFNK